MGTKIKCGTDTALKTVGLSGAEAATMRWLPGGAGSCCKPTLYMCELFRYPGCMFCRYECLTLLDFIPSCTGDLGVCTEYKIYCYNTV